MNFRVLMNFVQIWSLVLEYFWHQDSLFLNSLLIASAKLDGEKQQNIFEQQKIFVRQDNGMQLNNELMIPTRMVSWGVNALVTSQLHLMLIKLRWNLKKSFRNIHFTIQSIEGFIYFASELVGIPECISIRLMVCVLIIKRLIWYLFMFVFSFDVGCLLLLSDRVSVAISGSLLTPRVPVWCLRSAHLVRVTNCPHQQTSPGYKSGSGLLSFEIRRVQTPVSYRSSLRDWVTHGGF